MASPPELGQGLQKTHHGVLPVPPPAVLEILTGVPVRPGGPPGEAVTPTGAAILAVVWLLSALSVDIGAKVLGVLLAVELISLVVVGVVAIAKGPQGVDFVSAFSPAAIFSGGLEGGAGIAVAFVATVYGVGAANLFFLPFANPRHAHEYKVFEKMPLADDQVLVAADGDGLVGYLSVQQLGARVARIGLVAVAERHQGKGFGRALLEAGLQVAAASGAQEIAVVTQGTNPGAVAYYTAAGFAPTGSETWYHGWFDTAS